MFTPTTAALDRAPKPDFSGLRASAGWGRHVIFPKEVRTWEDKLCTVTSRHNTQKQDSLLSCLGHDTHSLASAQGGGGAGGHRTRGWQVEPAGRGFAPNGTLGPKSEKSVSKPKPAWLSGESGRGLNE